jgi:murein DD-endopeptidase MepM/ murein hydrolase activator NlpD
MVIPERTRRVHKIVVPFFLLKLSVVLVSLSAVFFIIIGIDYVHVLGRMAENKRLKGENYKLRQDMQVIRNKVDLMESSVERVRNYAKKLQMLTGQTGQGGAGMPDMSWGTGESDTEREPSSKPPPGKNHHSQTTPPATESGSGQPYAVNATPLLDRVERLEQISLVTETGLSELQTYLVSRSAIMNATPSLMPINGWLSSTFGYRRHPLDGSYRLHAGVDIAADSGTPVRAPADGTVIFSGIKEGYGKVVVIDHGYGIQTVFGHNSKLFVTQGQHLKRGDKISEVGSTGRSTGPHLHYEIRKNGIPINPLTFISRVRF